MTITANIYNRYQRYRTLQTHRIHALPVVILMPHSACNCKCVMCDIWKGNKNLRQLQEKDITSIINALRSLHTEQVLMSGGEALLHPAFFRFCAMLRDAGIRVSLHSTGLTLAHHAKSLTELVHDIIVSIDGDRETHDRIRRIPGAYDLLEKGIAAIRSIDPEYPITARSVIHRLNFRKWPELIRDAHSIGLDQLSFLPADVSSTAFNRNDPWNTEKQEEVLLQADEITELERITEQVISMHAASGRHPFIAESPVKLRQIAQYYAAHQGLAAFPYRRCNAPWVSTVVEADGTVRPCFFHAPIGNIHEDDLKQILNGDRGMQFRRSLDMRNNANCVKCVCSLYLTPGTKLND